MNEMIKSIYESVSGIVEPFKTLYPYQDIEADVDTGVVTFAPVKVKNLSLAGERLQSDNSLIVDAVSEVCFEVDIYKTINWNGSDTSAFEMAERLQTYLKSTQAQDTFVNNYGYEIMPVWSDITFQADFNTYKKWVHTAQFELFITKMSEIELSDKSLKNISVEVKEIGTIESSPAYNKFAHGFLKSI